MTVATQGRTKLALDIEADILVKRLGGVWHGRSAMCHCPAHDDRTPSLSVRVGNTSLLLKCFAGCDTSDVLRAIRRLGAPISSRPRGELWSANGTRSESLAERARAIWASASPVASTIAAHYLASRRLPTASPALRFHPRAPLGRGRAVVFRPALIAAVSDGAEIIAVQRIFLDPSAARLAPDLVRPKRLLGRPLGGAVRLQPCTDTLGLAEGVETAQSAQILLGIPVWATLGNERLAKIAVPPSVTRLVLLADADAPGRCAAALARAAYSAPGRAIEHRWPPGSVNDWNDALVQKGEEAGIGLR